MKMEVRKGSLENTSSWAVVTLLLWMCRPINSFCPPLCSCDDTTLLTDCHEARNLKMVPIFLNPQTKFLSLAQNQIKEISMSLQFYSELQLLDFSENQIESLGGNNFENLRNLKVLNASYNSIRILESGAFSGLSHTIVLDLSANQIERIDQATFRGLVGLRDLSLDRNRLDSLDWDLFSELIALERLTLRFNYIRILQPPFTFGPFLTAGILEPDSNNMSQRKNKSESEKLLPLTSGPSRVREGSEGPWTLRHILEVDLSWNQLAAVRNFGLVSLLPSLRTLNLCCNDIHTIEENAFSTFPTQSFPISHFIPNFIPNSHPKISPKISGNNESQVLKTKSGLTSVNLSQNRLTAIPSDALGKLSSSLVDLDLSSNGISGELLPMAFRSLGQLRRLRISKNPGIIRIHPTALLDNINLMTVEANHLPNLTEFPLGLLTNKPYLERLSLQFGQIRTLPGELFTNPVYSGQIDSLDLFGNPIDCNCSVWKLYEYVTAKESKNLEQFSPEFAKFSEFSQDSQHQNDLRQSDFKKMSIGSIRCSSPVNLQEFKIRELSRSDFDHCFSTPAFPKDYFELLVILLAALIVFLILIAMIIKICCLYRICPHRKSKSLDLDSKKDGTTLDEFCSNVVLGNVGCESSTISTSCTSNGGGKIGNICRDFTPPIPPSPAPSRNKNKTGTLPNGSYHGHGNLPLSYHRSPRTTTLGPRVPVSYDYDEEEDRYHQYMTIKNHQPQMKNHQSSANSHQSSVTSHHQPSVTSHHQPSQATLTHSNKLRFNPKMQLILDNDPADMGQNNPPPPLILHYECDYPDYRRSHAVTAQRYKQVPSVLV